MPAASAASDTNGQQWSFRNEPRQHYASRGICHVVVAYACPSFTVLGRLCISGFNQPAPMASTDKNPLQARSAIFSSEVNPLESAFDSHPKVHSANAAAAAASVSVWNARYQQQRVPDRKDDGVSESTPTYEKQKDWRILWWIDFFRSEYCGNHLHSFLGPRCDVALVLNLSLLGLKIKFLSFPET
ncbi:hypothetical protein LINGRAHAP2_LOCUS26149 [Linum grandiflorum]